MAGQRIQLARSWIQNTHYSVFFDSCRHLVTRSHRFKLEPHLQAFCRAPCLGRKHVAVPVRPTLPWTDHFGRAAASSPSSASVNTKIMPLLNGSSKHQNMRTAEALKSLHLCCMDLSEMICGSVLIHTEFWELPLLRTC